MALLRLKMEFCSTVWTLEIVLRTMANINLKWSRGVWHVGSCHDINLKIVWLIWSKHLVGTHSVARLLLLYKIVNSLVAIEPREYLCKPARKSRHLKTHTFKKIRCNTESYRLSFYPRTIELWNSLPEHIFTQAYSIANLKKTNFEKCKIRS